MLPLACGSEKVKIKLFSFDKLKFYKKNKTFRILCTYIFDVLLSFYKKKIWCYYMKILKQNYFRCM